jgi:hypothetical protein
MPSLGLKGHLWVVAAETCDALINTGFLVLASVSLYAFYLALTYERRFRKR